MSSEQRLPPSPSTVTFYQGGKLYQLRPLFFWEPIMKNDNQAFSAPPVKIAQFSTFSPLISQEFMREVRQIGITGINSAINQIPAPANGNTAVVTSETTTQHGTFSGIGSATPESVNGSTSPQDLLDRACQQSLIRSAGLAALLLPSIDVTPTESVFGPVLPRKELSGKNNGGGNKPMSPKQSNFVQQLCLQRGVSPEEVCGRTLENMTGADANAVIKNLTSQ